MKNSTNYKIEYKINNDNNKCKCELEKCLACSAVSLNKDLCIECNYNYYPIENDSLNTNEYINCYQEPQGNYLDFNDNLYKKCFYTCENCELNGDNINHNCLKCKKEYAFEININNYTNCYKECVFYYYFDNNNNYYCTMNFSCPNEYPILLEKRNECVIGDINYIKIKINEKL